MKDKEVMRFDYIFSYWIFIWWILYELKLINANPKLLLYIALLYIFVIVILAKKKNCHVLPFSISVLILKLYPLYSLRHTQITQSDVYFSFLFFLIYLSWLSINGGVKEVYDFYSFSSASDGILPPFEYYFNKFFDFKC